MEQPTRSTRRHILAAIALATDLPMPKEVSFNGSDLLVFHHDTMADAHAWTAHLGGTSGSFDREGVRYFSHSQMQWHGWAVQLHANEPLADEPLDGDTADQLSALGGES